MTMMTLRGSSGEKAAELDKMGFDGAKKKEKHPEPNNVS